MERSKMIQVPRTVSTIKEIFDTHDHLQLATAWIKELHDEMANTEWEAMMAVPDTWQETAAAYAARMVRVSLGIDCHQLEPHPCCSDQPQAGLAEILSDTFFHQDSVPVSEQPQINLSYSRFLP